MKKPKTDPTSPQYSNNGGFYKLIFIFNFENSHINKLMITSLFKFLSFVIISFF